MGIGLILPAFGLYSAGYILPGLVLALLTPLSLYTVKRNWAWPPAAALALITISSAFLIIKGTSPLLALAAILGSLAAWDLSDFQTRLNLAHRDDDPVSLERTHLLRLLPTLLAGFLLSWAALTFHFTLNFDRLILLIILGIAGLGLLISFLRQVD